MSRGLSVCLSLIVIAFAARASEVQDLRAEFERLRGDFNKKGDNTSIGHTESTLNSRYGPTATVTTKDGKLQISGLTQIWFTAMQDDHKGIVQPAPGNNL